MNQNNQDNERDSSEREIEGFQDHDEPEARDSGGTGLSSSELGFLNALLSAGASGTGHSRHDGEDSGDRQSRISVSVTELLRFLATRSGPAGGGSLHFHEVEEEDGDYVPDEIAEDDDDDEDEDDDDEDYGDGVYSYWGQRKFNDVGHYFPPVTEPQEAGLKLLYSGDFGPPPSAPVVNAKPQDSKPQSRRATRRSQRPLEQQPAPEANQYPAYHNSYRIPLTPIRKPFPPHHYRTEITRGLVPNSPGSVVAQYADKVYSGQFSLDSNIFYSCTQNHEIWVYDANSIGEKTVHPGTGHTSRMKLLNHIKGQYGNWTVTDSHLSPDNERLIYSSISPVVYLTKLQEPGAQHIALDFSGYSPRGGRRSLLYDDTFGIWTCRFSADGKEVVACGSHQIFVWDLTTHKRIVSIPAHQQDVNSCCWADTSSGNVLVSGSDDTMIKVWDRRSLSSNRPSGVLPGHTEGITSVSAKGDGRYIISNGKDHALRLWDLRMMREDEEVKYKRYGQPNYDYRYGDYRRPKHPSHPQDCSVMTFRGHSVFRTLIRCHFSPAETTGQAYVYSGSTDGKVYIWSLDGRIVETIDRTQSVPIKFDPSEPDLPSRQRSRNQGANDTAIRDCSWHPREPALLSCYWHRDDTSSIARHEWKSLGKRGLSLEDALEKGRAEMSERMDRFSVAR